MLATVLAVAHALDLTGDERMNGFHGRQFVTSGSLGRSDSILPI